MLPGRFSGRPDPCGRPQDDLMFALRGILPGLLASMILCVAARGAVRDGDRIVFAGSGLTEQNGFPAMTEAAVLLRFPDLNLAFRNIGRAGDTAGGWARGGPDRLVEEILAFR